jgi:hypothetical protein
MATNSSTRTHSNTPHEKNPLVIGLKDILTNLW